MNEIMLIIHAIVLLVRLFALIIVKTDNSSVYSLLVAFTTPQFSIIATLKPIKDLIAFV